MNPLWRAIVWAALVDAFVILAALLVCCLAGCSGLPGEPYGLAADAVVVVLGATAGFVIGRRS